MYAERILMGLLLGVIAIGCGLVLYPFFTAILWAGILTFSTWPAYKWLQRRLKIGGIWASLIMVLLCALAMVLPFALVGPDTASAIAGLRDQISNWSQNGLPPAPDWLQNLPFFGAELVDRWNIWAADLTGLTDVISANEDRIVKVGFGLLESLTGGVTRILVALFIAFFFWVSGEKIAVHLRAGLLRIAGPRGDRMIDVTGRAVRGAVYGIIGTAIVQGVLTGVGLSIAGVPKAIIFATIAGFLSVLPIGAPLIWIPSAAWLYSTGHTGHAIFLVLWGIFIVSGSDSLIRPYFISRGARIPFLLTLLGVLGGAVAFGLLGVFLGPTLLAIGYSLVTEFVDGDREITQTAPEQAPL
jgi:predicted PurR-regulated permease PerM